MKAAKRWMMAGIAAASLMGIGLKATGPAQAGTPIEKAGSLQIVGVLLPILPDLTVTADATQSSCVGVKFTVTLAPGFPRPSGNQAVKVRVIDKVFGIPQTVGEAT